MYTHFHGSLALRDVATAGRPVSKITPQHHADLSELLYLTASQRCNARIVSKATPKEKENCNTSDIASGRVKYEKLMIILKVIV